MSWIRRNLHVPHGYPLLLLDRIVAVEPGQSAEVVKRLSRNDPLVDGDGLVPGTILTEALAQCAGVAIGRPVESGSMLAKVDRFRCRRKIEAGQDLNVRVVILKVLGPNLKARGIVRSNGRVVAAGDLVLQIPSASKVGQARESCNDPTVG